MADIVTVTTVDIAEISKSSIDVAIFSIHFL